MTSDVKKVVICASGKGNRFLPITSSLPKEMFPIIDKPVIHYVIEEALVPGIEEIILVIKRHKRILADYVRSESNFAFKKKLRNIRCTIAYQSDKIDGNGAALIAASKRLKKEPVLALFADSFSLKKFSRLTELIKTYKKFKSPVISLIPLTGNHANIYGVAQVSHISRKVVLIKKMVEKPGERIRGSAYAYPNGFLITPEILLLVKKQIDDGVKELSIPEAISTYSQKKSVYGVVFRGSFFETGNQADYIKAQVRTALGKRIINKKDLTQV